MYHALSMSAETWLEDWMRAAREKVESRSPEVLADPQRFQRELLICSNLLRRINLKVQLSPANQAALIEDLNTYALFGKFDRHGLADISLKLATWINSLGR